MNSTKPFSWPAGKRAALSLTFDDARPSEVDRGIPILDAHGTRATFYVSLPAMEKRLEQWGAAVAQGHEIGNHTVTHPCSGNFVVFRGNALEHYTLSRIEDEITRANASIERLLGVQPVTFAYPCGQKTVGRGAQVSSYVPLVAKHFLAGRGFRDEASNDPSFCDFAQLYGVDADAQSFEQLKPWIDFAAQNGAWLILVAHEVGTMAHHTMVVETLDQICRYAQDPTNGIWIDTVAAIARYVDKMRVTAGISFKI